MFVTVGFSCKHLKCNLYFSPSLGCRSEDDEEERMDIAGVNIQEETACFLPPTVGETITRTCKDELFLDMSALRRKVAPIGKLAGIGSRSQSLLQVC